MGEKNRKMKVIHWMRDEKFTSSVSKFYNEYYSFEHAILYTHNDSAQSQIQPDLSIKQYDISTHSWKDFKAIRQLFSILKQYDLIVLHSFHIYGLILILFVILGLAKKMMWIEWGYDLYEQIGKKKQSLKERVLHAFKRKAILSSRAIVAIFPPDIDAIKERYPEYRGKLYYAPYIGTYSDSYKYDYDKDYCRLKISKESNEPIYIQIGHQANPLLNHIQVLQDLARFKDENIRILLPLSYGDRDNANKTEKVAQELFGEKAIILKDFMPKADYFNLLSRVDIAIFNTDRQIGLANINSLLKKNVKLFLSRNGVMYPYYKETGATVVPYDEVKNMTFEQFSSIICPDPKFEDYLNSYYDYRGNVGFWKKIYDDQARLKNDGIFEK